MSEKPGGSCLPGLCFLLFRHENLLQKQAKDHSCFVISSRSRQLTDRDSTWFGQTHSAKVSVYTIQNTRGESGKLRTASNNFGLFCKHHCLLFVCLDFVSHECLLGVLLLLRRTVWAQLPPSMLFQAVTRSEVKKWNKKRSKNNTTVIISTLASLLTHPTSPPTSLSIIQVTSTGGKNFRQHLPRALTQIFQSWRYTGRNAAGASWCCHTSSQFANLRWRLWKNTQSRKCLNTCVL